MQEAYQTVGLKPGTFGSGLARGFVSGVNPLPEAVTRALLPKWGGIEDYVATAGEVRPGEEGGHMLGNVVGFGAGTLVPLGIAGKAAKALKAVDAAGHYSKGAKAAMLGLEGLIGAGQGFREAEDRGRYYNQGAGALPTAMAVATGAGMNLVPGLKGMSKVLGVNAGIGATQALTENAMQWHNGLAQDLDTEALLRGAAGGAVMGGAMHGAFHGLGALADRQAKKAATAAEAHSAAAKAAASPVQAAAAPAPNPVLEALREKIRSTGSTMNVDEQIAQKAHFARMKPLLDRHEELLALKEAAEAALYMQEFPVHALRVGEDTPWQLGGSYTSGKTRKVELRGGEKPVSVDARDVLDNMIKVYRHGNTPVTIREGFQPVRKVTPEFLDINGEKTKVLIVGERPISKDKVRQKRYLVAIEGKPETFNDPIEVGAEQLEGLKKRFGDTQGKVTPDSSREWAQRGEFPSAEPLTHDQEYDDLLARIALLEAELGGTMKEPPAPTPAPTPVPQTPRKQARQNPSSRQEYNTPWPNTPGRVKSPLTHFVWN